MESDAVQAKTETDDLLEEMSIRSMYSLETIRLVHHQVQSVSVTRKIIEACTPCGIDPFVAIGLLQRMGLIIKT